MRLAEIRIEGVTPLVMRRSIEVPKLSGESDDDFERRTWRETVHATPDGLVFLPGRVFHKCMVAAAAYSPMKIKGRQNATYTKKFISGIMPDGDMTIEPETRKENVVGVRHRVPADGVSGSGKKVWRYFPTIMPWGGTLSCYVFDDAITPAIFESVLRTCALFIGVGTWTPQRGGYNGRFNVLEVSWVEDVAEIKR